MTGDMTSVEAILAARRSAATDGAAEEEASTKLVLVSLDGEWFAVAGAHVREILAAVPVHYLPGCPASMDGVINVRGAIETAIDLRGLLGAPAAPGGERIRFLLCEAGGMRSAVRVDEVLDVLDVAQGRIAEAPPTLTEERKAVVAGVLSLDQRVVTVLDLDRMFARYRAGLG
jgi:purine-binding chemotaxis protein CheW